MRYVSVASVALALTACGTVNGVCPGESNDNVACTADICDLETNQWVHIPENSACGSGEVCTATGCTASPLSGSAFLFGYDANDATRNHAGITVTLVSADGATGSGSGSGSTAGPSTTTTAADGSWSISAEPGTYTVQYSKDKFVTVTTPGVVVGAMGGGAAPAVTLKHYQEFNHGANIENQGFAIYLPDRLLTYSEVFDEDQYQFYATPLDASADTVDVFTGEFSDVLFGANGVVWVNTTDESVWARPYDGSTPPVLLFTAPVGASVDVEGTPNDYAVIYEHGAGATGLDSLWVAKVDGSAPPTTAAWTAPDTNHTFVALANNATTALFFTSTSVADTQPAHRIDLASNTTVSVSVGVTSTTLHSGNLQQSPDGNWVYGTITATTGATVRGFIAPLTPTPLSAGITVSSLTGTNADAVDGHFEQWLPDSSAFVYTALAATSGSADLREWKTSASSSTEIASSSAYDEEANDSVGVYGSSVLHYVDYSNGFHFYGLNGTGTAVLDPNPDGAPFDLQSSVGSNGDVYIVEAEGVPTKVVSIAIPGGNVAAATTTTLIPTVPAGCFYEDALSDTTFYQLCANTGALNAYAESNATPTRQLTNVQLIAEDNEDALILAAPASGQLVYVGSDYNFYSVTNDGTGDPVLVSTSCDPTQGFEAVGNWLFCADAQQAMTRVSNLDGSVIDEPLDACNMVANFEAETYTPPAYSASLQTSLQFDPSGTRLWSPGAECQQPPVDLVAPNDATFQIFQESMTPVANLP